MRRADVVSARAAHMPCRFAGSTFPGAPNSVEVTGRTASFMVMVERISPSIRRTARGKKHVSKKRMIVQLHKIYRSVYYGTHKAGLYRWRQYPCCRHYGLAHPAG